MPWQEQGNPLKK